jgi:hypothetical protein
MGTSKSNSGGTGGGWTSFKRSSTSFAKHGGQQRAAKAMGGYVAAVGGVAAAVAAAGAGSRTGQSLGNLLVQSTGPTGLAGGLQAVGLERLIGQDRFTVLSELVTAFAGVGSDLEAQAARNALLDVLDELLPEDEGLDLATIQLDEAAVSDNLCRFIAALVYNLAIPIIDERLTQLQNPQLAQQRDRELRGYVDGLVRMYLRDTSPLGIDWQGPDGRGFIDDILRAVYAQLEAWQ